MVIGIVVVGAYFVFFNKKTPTNKPALTTSTGAQAKIPTTTAKDATKPVGQEFLSILLNVKNIKLNDAIFSENAFTALKDSSITLVSEGNEGRANPFAPIGSDALVTPPPVVPPITSGAVDTTLTPTGTNNNLSPNLNASTPPPGITAGGDGVTQ